MKTVMGQVWTIGTLILLFGGLGACGGASEPPDAATVPLNGAESAVPPPVPPPPPQGAFLAQLTSEQTAQLNALGVEVVVPGVVPPTFSVTEIRGKAATGSGPDGGAAYAILYRDSQSRCFAIEFAASGIGDLPATKNRLPIQPPLFADQGYGLNYGVYQETAMRQQFPKPELYTDWLISPAGAYRLIGANYINVTFPSQAKCQDITPTEAKEIAESLTVIAPEVMGDGEAVK